MESMSEFETRLKRTQSTARVRRSRIYAPDNNAKDTTLRHSKSSWSMAVVVMLVSCVLVASMIAYAREDIARVLSGTNDAEAFSTLES